jgi:hypothetical protein
VRQRHRGAAHPRPPETGTSERLPADVGAVVPLLTELLRGFATAPGEEVDAAEQHGDYQYGGQTAATNVAVSLDDVTDSRCPNGRVLLSLSAK